MIKFKSEKGLTLVEVLAAIVIMTIIFTSIISILNLTAKTNRTSEDIIDATYLAQQEMEFIYKLSEEDSELSSFYDEKLPSETWNIYEKEVKEQDEFLVEIRQKETEDDMVRIVVTVYEVSDSVKENPRAKMETLLKWGAEANEVSP